MTLWISLRRHLTARTGGAGRCRCGGWFPGSFPRQEGGYKVVKCNLPASESFPPLDPRFPPQARSYLRRQACQP